MKRKEYPDRTPESTDERRQEAKRLRRHGHTFRDIAERLDIDESTVRYYCKKAQ